jgi:lipoate-protein ligase A
VIGPYSEARLAGSVLESYQRLSIALLAALRTLGIHAQAVSKTRSVSTDRNPNPVCFEVPSDYEITFQGKKLIGSAQARRKEGVLQHGSLPLCGDLTRITQVLYYPNQSERETAASRLLERASTVERALGLPVSYEIAALAFSEAFQSTLNLELFHQDLTDAEKTRVEELVSEKFANQTWTNRV